MIQNAMLVGRIATGEVTVSVTDDGKNPSAVALGRMGDGKARAEKDISQAAQRNREESRENTVG